jgi:DNA-binding transcriptional LysR family regulator
MMTNRLELLQSFIVVAQKLSFVEAANVLQIDPSALSRRIKQLEKHLNVRLFNRSTRRVALTEAGALYLEQCQNILDHLDEADAMISALSAEPRGLLRVTLPVTFGQRHISPALPEFLALHPLIDLDLYFTDQFIDVLKENIDVAIRIGQLKNSQLIVRQLALNYRVLCASPDYLSRYGCPKKPEELKKHRCLSFSPAVRDIWHFSRSNRQITIPVHNRICADNAEALYQAALGGCGIAMLAMFIVKDDVQTGRLQIVLPDWKLPMTDICAVLAAERYIPSKTQVFVDFLANKLKNIND